MDYWFVYIVECSDGTFYTGITLDLKRRIEEHNSSKKGAKYTKSRRPVVLYHAEIAAGRSLASSREAQIKKLSRTSKWRLGSYGIRIIYENLTRERI